MAAAALSLPQTMVYTEADGRFTPIAGLSYSVYRKTQKGED